MNKELKEEFERTRWDLETYLRTVRLEYASKMINDGIAERSYLRKFFTVEDVKPGQEVSYAIADEFNSPIWILPGMGYVAQDYMELLAEEVNVRMFTVQAAKDWLIKYARKARTDVFVRACQAVSKVLSDYEIEAMWRTIIPAVTTAFDGAGILPPRPAPIYQLPNGDPAAGYFSKEIVNRMMVGAQRQGKKLTHLVVSPEDLADIREWTDVDVDPATRRSIFQAAGLGSIFNVQLVSCEDLGVRGKYNIHDNYAEYGPFKGKLGENEEIASFNDYAITHGNIVDNNANLVLAGETQVYGFCEDAPEQLRFAKTPYEAFIDHTLLRKQKMGFFGWQEMGVCCLDSTCMVMGIIDRALPSYNEVRQTWIDSLDLEKLRKEEEENRKRIETDGKINRLTAMLRKNPDKLKALLLLMGD